MIPQKSPIGPSLLTIFAKLNSAIHIKRVVSVGVYGSCNQRKNLSGFLGFCSRGGERWIVQMSGPGLCLQLTFWDSHGYSQRELFLLNSPSIAPFL